MKSLIVLFGVAAASLSAVMVRWSTAPSLILVFYRMCIAVLMLLPVVLLRHRDEVKHLTWKMIWPCLCSGVFLGLHFSTYFQSLRMTSMSSAVVLVNTEALFVALGSVLVLRKKLTKRGIIAVLLAFAGSVVVATAGSSGGQEMLSGDMMALAGAFCIAVYTMIGTVCLRHMSTMVYTTIVYAMAAVTTLVIALVSGTPIFGYEPINYLTALGMAVFCTLLGHNIFSWGLKYLSPPFIATLKLAEPIFATIWGLTLFHEVPGVKELLGGAIIIGGIALYSSSDTEA